MSQQGLPLQGLKVIEFSGLAPGPYVGMVLADFGADVIRIDRCGISLNPDSLCRGKRSIAISPKDQRGNRILKELISTADVVIDPYRPGVLEKLGLGPEEFHGNKGLIFARLTGFQREGPYANMAGHDINYIALSGVLSMLGSANGPPRPPSNLMADFAGGSLICLLGILMALVERSRSGKGQIVEADMVNGSRYASSFIFLSSYLSHPSWGPIHGDGRDETRGQNTLDGGAPWYGVYKCKQGGWMSLGAIETHFYAELLEILKNAHPEPPAGLRHPSVETQHDRATWNELRSYFESVFKTRTRDDWEKRFVGTDACCVPVLTRDEAALKGVLPSARPEDVESQRPIVPRAAPRLSRTPASLPRGAIGCAEEDEDAVMLLTPGEDTEKILEEIGVGAEERRSLYRDGVIDSPDKPDEDDQKGEGQGVKAKL
ncbi:putative alpha-methylacyl-CoA racemase [Violaceomyces palustris]|uniref:Alpha-methylacyl-CoA racemase n=1 Tax=Violaceomyces palustris TaxID=1673888 RepID=A0ACD0P577_9BASI|nr:putative alpha-methylacyl-CoA racemase [Violaceomyces palustris]